MHRGWDRLFLQRLTNTLDVRGESHRVHVHVPETPTPHDFFHNWVFPDARFPRNSHSNRIFVWNFWHPRSSRSHLSFCCCFLTATRIEVSRLPQHDRDYSRSNRSFYSTAQSQLLQSFPPFEHSIHLGEFHDADRFAIRTAFSLDPSIAYGCYFTADPSPGIHNSCTAVAVARGSWLVARGSWLVARGSWLVAVAVVVSVVHFTLRLWFRFCSNPICVVGELLLLISSADDEGLDLAQRVHPAFIVKKMLLLMFCCHRPSFISLRCTSSALASLITSFLRSFLSPPWGVVRKRSSMRALHRSDCACARLPLLITSQTCAEGSNVLCTLLANMITCQILRNKTGSW